MKTKMNIPIDSMSCRIAKFQMNKNSVLLVATGLYHSS